MGYTIVSNPFAIFKWEALFREWSVFGHGFLNTIILSILALVLALVLGVIFGIFGALHYRIPKRINKIYISVIQNTPLVIQIFFLYNMLPHLGIKLSVFVVGILGIGIYHGAYIAEVVRAGIQAVAKGQTEAAISQGFNYMQTMRYIVLPQAIKLIFPPLTNQVVSLVKNTSVMAMVAGGDLMYTADSWSSNNLYYGPAYVVTALLYLLLCLPIARFAARLERKMGVAI
ncbi:polar amino acid ABC transporter permease [Clostridium pasteurianum]|uniref:amino acid ABC transporter permease n=1 Tax=Clostridium pasteurianum TaxID=1501 RepID=UPI0002A77F5E|nr:polar amino acid ABC transporter permease [Clostridium pasteurianum DSM 525 = ATCC 6013]AOZ80909.1 polar amino acid ABC transporter permease [Clostridium pasteurianum]ELP59309.1 polar amino acid ABC transporter inner membrane subunit [Clostridium pasteurianum DSM 525 = ATCC 6013]OMH21269.1 polar amino acid ABC transporter permease [Clostridium pasteurianum]